MKLCVQGMVAAHDAHMRTDNGRSSVDQKPRPTENLASVGHEQMPSSRTKRTYHHLIVHGSEPTTDIWLVDVDGHPVQKETGILDTHLLPGDDAVQFGLGTVQYPIYLQADGTFAEAELKQGPTCDYRITDLDLDEEDEGARVTYYTDAKGYWLRREWKPQCRSEVFLTDRCQGVEGHKGVHWCYSPSGDFQWGDNDDDPQHEGAAGSTPPGHEDYVSPIDMQEHYHVSHDTDRQVTDKQIIAMLEDDKTPEPNASIDRPLILDEQEGSDSSPSQGTHD